MKPRLVFIADGHPGHKQDNHHFLVCQRTQLAKQGAAIVFF